MVSWENVVTVSAVAVVWFLLLVVGVAVVGFVGVVVAAAVGGGGGLPKAQFNQNWPKMVPGRLPNEALEGPKWTLMTPNGLWRTNGWLRRAKGVTKAAPKGSQMGQEEVRRGPLGTPSGPKGAHGVAKMHPR